MIQTIVFDMGGVLIRWDPARIVHALGLEAQQEALLLREVLRSIEWLRMDRGLLTPEEGIASICTRVPPALHPQVRKLVLGWWDLYLDPVPGMEQLIAGLKAAGYQILLLSNAAFTLRTYFPLLPGSQFFDDVYVSSEHRMLKPEHEIYEDFLQHFGLQAETCFFVDDNPANVEAAMLVGFAGAAFHGDTAALRRSLTDAGVRLDPNSSEV